MAEKTIATDKEVAVIEKQYSPLLSKIPTSIASPKEMENATIILSGLNKYKDQLTARKEELTKPLNAALKAWRAVFKPREEKLEESITALRREMGRYQLEADTKAREAEEKLAARVGEGRGKLKQETAMRRMDEIERPDTEITTDAGAVRFRDSKNFEILSPATLLSHPPFVKDLLSLATDKGLTEQLVRQYMKNGEELPGVRYFMEKVVVNSR